jgi:amino acid adenylation domain-containing protein
MEPIGVLLSRLRRSGVRLRVEGEHLRYRAAEGALTPGLLSELRERKAEIVDFLGRPIRPVPRDRDLPASHAQERLWFLDRTGITGSAYNLPLQMRLRGELDRHALRGALGEILRRHESLRTAFQECEGCLLQVIQPPPEPRLPVVDLCGLAEEVREIELRRLAAEEGERRFRLDRGPLLRTLLVALAPVEHVLLATLHHISADGWSLAVFMRELGALYAAFSRGKASPLPELPVQYADFAAWQRELLAGPRLAEPMRYWKASLEGCEPLRLPTDHPRPPVETFRGGAVTFELPEAVCAALEAGRGQTPFMTLLAAFQALLARYTGQRRILVGSPIANRNRAEVEGLIGFFVNSLALATDLGGDPRAEELLARVRETALGAYAHQDLPFEKLVEELQPGRALSHNPLFQVMFTVQQREVMAPRLDLPGLEVTLPESEPRVRFDLEMHFSPEGRRMLGYLLYNADLFEAATARRMAGHFQNLLAGLLEDPGRRLSALPLLGEAERERLRVEWNDTSREIPRRCIHELFEERARMAPEREALVFAGRSWTYRRLNESANRLAHRLIRLGVGPDVPVALFLERSAELVVAILAVLKAGGAYLPLETGYPAERLAAMLADAGPPVLLTQAALADRLPGFAGWALAIDGDAPWAGESAADPPCRAAPENLAYVMYTSGSTGRPKGIAVPHRGVVRLALGNGFAEVAEDETLLLFAPVSFDASTFEIWAALLNGARLAVHPPGLPSLAELAGFVDAHGVTTLWLTASLFQSVAQEHPETLGRLRRLLSGGDVLPAPVARRLLAGAPGLTLLNGYGPTENTTFTTTHAMRSPEDAGRSVPIGRPIGNTRAYVVDPDFNLMPEGVPGELVTGGGGLARGYVGRPDLTAERFVPDPFGGPGGRLYRTGDLASWGSGGTLRFHGRIDRQVKIRGFRVEPAEVESVLLGHPGVREAVVEAALEGDEESGDRRLAAWVVPDSGWQPPEEMTGESSGQVSGWQSLFDGQIYAEPWQVEDPLFNTVGWLSTYDGRPIPPDQMRVWADDVVGRVLELEPRRVLEIGCGTGMLLFRIAPHCELYEGSDFSRVSLDYVRNQIEKIESDGGRYAHVRLAERRADDFAGVEPGSFDAVVLSSIVQYFPSLDYLIQVIAGSLRALRPGGSIVLGDLRSLPLLEAFHASVQLFRAEPGLPLDALARRVRAQVGEEKELLVDPELFPALPARFPEIARVRVHLQRGRDRNELTGFRFHAVLTAGEAPDVPPPDLVDGTAMGFAELRAWLVEHRPERVCFAGLPNARVRRDALAAALLRSGVDGVLRTAADLRQALAASSSPEIEPEDLRELARDLGYEIEIGWAPGAADGRFDAAFARRGTAAIRLAASDTPRPWATYANDPLRAHRIARLGPDLRRHAEERLPASMVPSTFTILDHLPLTPSGKVDRRALPAFSESLQSLQSLQSFSPPRSPLEETVAALFADLLGRAPIGIHDDFFALGGHSLLATQLASRLRSTLAVEIPLRQVFEEPTVAGIAAWIGRQLAGVAGVEGAAPREAPPIVPVARDTDPPASFAQQRLWFLERAGLAGGAYDMPVALRLTGRLDRAALERALGEIVRRHEALRTRFREVDGEVFQEVLPPFPVTLTSEADPRPFDLAAEPPVRFGLGRLGEAEHVLAVTFHHIACDGWSIDLFLRELAALYRAYARGLPSPLPDLPVQYADFAVWQRAWLAGEALDGMIAYWRGRLADLAPLELPTDRPRPRTATSRGAGHAFEISPEVTEALQAWGRRQGATLFMTLLAAFQVLLSRSSGQRRVAVGSPIANRNRSETEALIGMFVNTLVLAGEVEPEEPASGLLGRVREVVLGAYAHQDLPFEKLVEELRPARDLSRNPLFQAVLALQQREAIAPRLDLPGLEARPVPSGEPRVRVDLELHLWPEGRGLRGVCVVNRGLFDTASAVRLTERFGRLLAGIGANPALAVARLPLLGEAERHQVLAEWSDTAAPLPGGTVHERFAAQAAASPDAPALAGRGSILTYGELDRAANRLARRLRRFGPRRITPESTVAVCLESSPEMVLACLAVLKAGGAFVPLDPAQPAERLAGMLEDSRAVLLVARADGARRLAGTGVPALVLGGEEGVEDPAAGEDSSPPDPAAGSVEGGRRLAYVIFTSGSTGRPRGVAVEHAALLNLAAWHHRAFGLTSRDRVSQVAGVGFDAAVWEVWPALLAGASVHLADEAARRSPEELRDWLLAARITVAFTPTPLAEHLPRLPWPVDGALRLLLTGGDTLHAYPGNLPFRLINNYGPTENAVVATSGPVPAAGERPLPSIGRPIANVRVRLLDASLEPVPAGVPGEVCLAGASLARGYLHRPAETAERFIPDPWASEPGARLYRTGDRARFLPDGEIDFLGRLDRQLKLRGFRIEPAEIEARLAEHPGVREAAVLLEAVAGRERLVAFVAAPEALDSSGLRRHLAEHLPEAMIPAAFAVLPALPRTPNGKLDRAALPAIVPHAVSAPPSGPVEERVAAAFADLLGLDRVGADDGFFELGGHSLLAVRLAGRLRAEFGVEVPLAQLFATPTVAGLARFLGGDAAPSTSWPSAIVPLRAGGSKPPLFCAPPAGGSPFCYLALADRLDPDRPFLGLQTPGLAPGEKPLASVEEIAARFVEAVLAVQPEGPWHLGGWSFGATVAFEMARQLERRGRVGCLALLDGGVLEAPPHTRPRLANPLHLARVLREVARFVRQVERPRTYAELRGLARWAGLSLPASWAEVARRGAASKLRFAGRLLRDALRSLRVFAANTAAGLRYAPGGYGGAVTLFRTGAGASDDPVLRGLSALSGGGVEVRAVPGNHMSLLLDPAQIAALAGLLEERLAREGDALPDREVA